MGKNIKGEFKDFISTLSTEICKQVLLEELKGINNSFGKIEKDYKALCDNYTKNINSIKEQLNQLQGTNQKLAQFIISINDNNTKVNNALDLINGEHKVITDKIIKDNDKLFNNFSIKATSLNASERNEFIKQLTSSMDSHSKKYAVELSKIVNGGKIEEIEVNLTGLSNKVKIIKYDLKSLVRKIDTSVKDKVLESEKNLTSKLQITNLKVDAVSSEFNDKIAELSAKMDKSNKIIIALTSVIIVLCIVLMFVK